MKSNLHRRLQRIVESRRAEPAFLISYPDDWTSGDSPHYTPEEIAAWQARNPEGQVIYVRYAEPGNSDDNAHV